MMGFSYMHIKNYRIISKNLIIFLCFVTLVTALLYYFSHIKNHISTQKAVEQIDFKYQDIVSWITSNTLWYQYGNNIGWANFDRVYFITLEERLENVKRVIERLGIGNSAFILQAINKKNLNMSELVSLNIVDKTYLAQLEPRQYGAIAAHLSHFAVMLHCLKDDAVQTCVIFEDDIYRPAIGITDQIADFHKRTNRIYPNWDILYLDYSYEEGHSKTYQDVRKLKGALGNHAYVINKKLVPKLITEWFPMRDVNDVVFRTLVRNNTILAVGPDKARYFAQNRMTHGSTIDPGFLEYEILSIRYKH